MFPRLVTPGRANARYRVLLADNHGAILNTCARLLRDDFDLVAVVPDGRQALESALRLNPDVAILDISMPELDGFQTLRELRRAGSRARVVFLTMHESDAYVAAAIASGAQGYVLKTRLHSDLLSALDHVLGGRTFVPSLTSLFEVTGVGHTVQFHEQDHFALDEASEFLSAALGSGEPVAVIHSEQTLKDISRRLRERKLNLPAMAAKGQYVEMDSSKALLQIMRDGRPDPDFVARIVQDLNRIRIYAGGPQSRLNLWGAISPFLCRDGNFEAALEIERMWSKLTRDLPFLTVCAYPIECFHAGGSEESFANVCAEHGVVNHAYA